MFGELISLHGQAFNTKQAIDHVDKWFVTNNLLNRTEEPGNENVRTSCFLSRTGCFNTC